MSLVCPVCENPKFSRFRMCAECNSIYGDDQGEWPPWIAFLVADDNRLDWLDERLDEYEVSFSDLTPDIETALEHGWLRGEKVA